MKKVLLFVLCFFCLNGFADNKSQNAKSQLIDKTLVVVNEDVITQSEVDKALSQARQQLAKSNTPMPSNKQLRMQVINNLIAYHLQLQFAKRLGITVSDSELNNAIVALAKRNKATLQQLKDEVEASGLNYSDYRKQFRNQMIIGRLHQQVVGQSIIITDQEVKTFLQQVKKMSQPNQEYRLEDILITTPDNPSADEIKQARQKALRVKKQIEQGKSFRELAAAESGENNALKGGDLGWRKIGGLPSIFVAHVRKMQISDVVGPIQAPNGFHIIKLLDTRAAKQKLTTKRAKMILYQNKFEQKLQVWLRQLREEAYVKIL